jgi:small subunit ribosomal protein S24e
LVVMEFKVKQDTYNPLLKRKELSLDVDHEKEGSPSRVALRDAIASKYSTKSENVFVVQIQTPTGSQHSLCEAQVYDDPEAARKMVPKHIQIRNLPSEERKKIREESKKAEEKPKPEKPKAAAKAGKEEKGKQEGKPTDTAKAQAKERETK